MAKTFLQVRTEESDKEMASMILEQLGTNLSSVVNMLLKQIILTKSIPFEIKLPESESSPYTADETLAELQSTMSMEGMPLTLSDIELLSAYRASSDKEAFRNRLLEIYKEE